MTKSCTICRKEDEFSQKEEGKCIFHCEKENWYEGEEGKKDWKESRNLVKRFWEEVREKKMMTEDYDFSRFVFPEFESFSLSFPKEENGVYGVLKDANFWKLGDNYSFEEELCFERAIFLKDCNINLLHFRKYVSFDNATFFGDVLCTEAVFFKEAHFSAKFFRSNRFLETSFYKEAAFHGAQFSENFSTSFTDVHFEFRDPTFQTAAASFVGIDFPKTVRFRNCNLSHVSFLDSNVEQVRFDECSFESEKKRKILWDETAVLQKKDASTGDFEKVENIYRQFKKNFDDKRDWENGGDFHIGEMEMRLKKWEVKPEGLRFHIFLLKLYSKLSRYGERPGIVVDWMIRFFWCSGLILSFYRLGILYCGSGLEISWERVGVVFSIFTESFGVVLENITPFLSKFNLEKNPDLFYRIFFDIYWFFSLILWALLVISLRRKFKR